MQFQVPMLRVGYQYVILAEVLLLLSHTLSNCGEWKVCMTERDEGAGRWLHSLMVCSGLVSVAILGDYLIRLYAFCGRLLEANLAFCKMSKSSVYTWYAIISAHAIRDDCERVFELYHLMLENNVQPNKYVFPCIVKACGSMLAIDLGIFLHDQIINSGLESDLIVGSALIDMYAKFGLLEDAHRVFEELPNRNVVSWGAMISGCAQHGYSILALELLRQMQDEGIKPNKVTLLCILKACSSLGAFELGKLIHDLVIRSELKSDLAIGNTLVDMYAKCGSLEKAREVFNNLPTQNVVSYGAMIAGYAQHDQGANALDLLERMQQKGIQPNRVIFLGSLKACSITGAIEQGEVIHNQIIRNGLDSDIAIGSSLIDMYAECGELEGAFKVFDVLPDQNIVSCAAIISGYTQRGQSAGALKLFVKMQQEGLEPDKFVFSCILKACGSMGDLWHGNLIHDQIIKSGLEADVVVGSSLVDMYAKCGGLEQARKVFDDMPKRNAVSWGSMIAGYTQNGQGFPALEVFEKMVQEGVQPDKVRFLCILKACGGIGASLQGRVIHGMIIKCEVDSDRAIGNSLIDMYAKSGSLEEAQKVFDHFKNPDVLSWGALIAGYTQKGNYILASHCFEEMQCHGFKPNDTIYTSILSACSHAGLVEEGRHHFKAMIQDHGIIPTTEHFNCMVDLLGRSGCLEEAGKLLQSMPLPNDSMGWTSMLAACRTYGNRNLARHCFIQVLQLDPSIGGGYEIMSNIYGDAHLWEGVHKIQQLRKSAGAWKKPGRAWIEVKDDVHEFVVREKTHAQIHAIHNDWVNLRRPIKDAGYIPQLDLVWQSAWEKEEHIFTEYIQNFNVGLEFFSSAALAPTEIRYNQVTRLHQNARSIISISEMKTVSPVDPHYVYAL